MSACAGGEAPSGSGGEGAGAFPPVEVKTITLEARPVPQSTEYLATIQSLRSTTVQPQVEGLVRQIFVRAGQRVRAGQPLVQIDPDRQQATVNATESQRAAREADLELATQQLERMQQTARGGRRQPRGPGPGRDDAQERRRRNSPWCSRRSAKARSSCSTTASPRRPPGIVGDIPVREGDRVTPADADHDDRSA